MAWTLTTRRPYYRNAYEPRASEPMRRSAAPYSFRSGCGRPRRPGSSGLGRSRILHKPVAIAVWADLGISGIQLAAVHIGVIVRLILVGKEIDADSAMLRAVRLELVLQCRPNSLVLR